MTDSHRTVGIVDDHPVIRLGVVALIDACTDLRVAFETSSIADAREMFRRATPDIGVVDVRIGDDNGLDLVRALRAEHGSMRLVVLTMFDGPEIERQARAAGADEFVRKSAPGSAIVAAVRGPRTGDAARSAAPTLRPQLSPREIEVLSLISDGSSNAEIARCLGMSFSTARTHVAHILEKLGAKDRTSAATIADRCGIIAAARTPK